MADLTSYINYAVSLDKSAATPVLRLTDLSVYPTGVPAIMLGVVNVTQPDGITINGNFDFRDIAYVSGVFTVAVKELRLAGDGNFQNGLYSITYVVRAAGYTDSTLTQTFVLSYQTPEATISEAFDVFTPSLKVSDNTSYVNPSCTLLSVVRSWTAVVESLGVVSSNFEQLDLLLYGNYYDAVYDVRLRSVISYILKGNSWVTLKDAVTATGNYATEVPLSLNGLYTQLNIFKASIKDPCCKDVNSRKQDYIYAFTLFQHLMMRGKCGVRIPIRDMVDDIQTILNSGADPVYVPTNQPIQRYSFTNFCGGALASSPGPTSVVISGVTSTTATVEATVPVPGSGPTAITLIITPVAGGLAVVYSQAPSILQWALEGLTPLTAYNVKVRLDYPGSISSALVDGGDFTTAASELAVYTAVLTFEAFLARNAGGVGAVTDVVDPHLKLEFNAITPLIGTPQSMSIRVSGVEQLTVDYSTDYSGTPFRFTDKAGVAHNSVFANGYKDF